MQAIAVNIIVNEFYSTGTVQITSQSGGIGKMRKAMAAKLEERLVAAAEEFFKEALLPPEVEDDGTPI